MYLDASVRVSKRPANWLPFSSGFIRSGLELVRAERDKNIFRNDLIFSSSVGLYDIAAMATVPGKNDHAASFFVSKTGADNGIKKGQRSTVSVEGEAQSDRSSHALVPPPRQDRFHSFRPTHIYKRI